MNEKVISRIIVVVTIIVLAVVAFLTQSSALDIDHNLNLGFFPKFHASINTAVSLLIIIGVYFIKQKNVKVHRTMMLTAFLLSSIFLLSYILYHSLSDGSILYGVINHDGIVDDIELASAGSLRYVYYFVLLTHIVCAAFILPLILFTFTRALTGKIEQHKKIAKWTFPIWLYVSITGVLVYFLISPYYPY